MQCPCLRPWPLSFCKASGKALQEKPYRKPSSSFQPFCPYPPIFQLPSGRFASQDSPLLTLPKQTMFTH